MLSTPVCGVDNKNDHTEALYAPCFFNDADTGITEHEHNGKGIPRIADLKTDRSPVFLPKWDSINSWDINTDKSPAIINPKIKYGDTWFNKIHISFIKLYIISLRYCLIC